MKIVEEFITLTELKQMSTKMIDDMVKAVVDIEKKIIAVDAEMHSDLESLLIKNGSLQKDIWGINFYPEFFNDDFVEFDSLINIRPAQNNRSRSVDSEEIQKKIMDIVDEKVKA